MSKPIVALVAQVVPPTDDGRPQTVVRVQDAFWAHYGARDWLEPSVWHPVDPEPCPECGHYQALCWLCRRSARHFLDAPWVVAHAYLCDRCVAPFFEYMNEGAGAWPEAELGAYGCCDGCGCDGWRH